MLTYDNFPQIANQSNSYSQWVARVTSQTLPKIVGGIAKGAAMTALTGGNIAAGLATGGVNLLGDVTNLYAEGQGARLQVGNLQGQSNGLMTSYVTDLIGFIISKKQIPSEIAKQIDDYFTRFGYAIKRIATPERNVRPYFTYVKTIGCNAVGNAPVSAVTTINNCMNKGITFWNGTNSSNIGDYSVDNSPSSPSS